MNMENERLTKMLTIVCANYNTLQSHFTKLVQKENFSPTKRKADDENYGNIIGGYGNSDGSISDGDPYKRVKEVKTNVSRIFVRTDPSDKSHVSFSN